MLVLGQGHSVAHPYILRICTVASLSSPLRGPSLCSSFSRQHEVFTKKVTAQKGRRLGGNLCCCCRCCCCPLFPLLPSLHFLSFLLFHLFSFASFSLFPFFSFFFVPFLLPSPPFLHLFPPLFHSFPNSWSPHLFPSQPSVYFGVRELDIRVAAGQARVKIMVVRYPVLIVAKLIEQGFRVQFVPKVLLVGVNIRGHEVSVELRQRSCGDTTVGSPRPPPRPPTPAHRPPTQHHVHLKHIPRITHRDTGLNKKSVRKSCNVKNYDEESLRISVNDCHGECLLPWFNHATV